MDFITVEMIGLTMSVFKVISVTVVLLTLRPIILLDWLFVS